MINAFSKIWITIILIVLIVGGFFAWQKFGEPKEESQNTISLVYTFENFAWGEQLKRIELSKDGNISYSNKIGGKEWKNYRQLSAAELKEFSNFIISQKFFDLPGDLANPRCADGPTEYLEITINQKTHRSGGNCVENGAFKAVAERLKTIGWKIYKNEEVGFEMSYPKDWVISIISEMPSYILFDSPDYSAVEISSGLILEPADTGTRIVVSSYENSRNFTLDQLISSYTTQQNKKTINLDGAQGVALDTVVEFGAYETVIVLIKNDIAYQINRIYPESQKILHEESFNQMLSTFRFLE